MKPGEDIMAMVADINRAVRDDELDVTPWEENFLSSISLRAREGLDLTEAQEKALDRLWKKATGQ